MRILFKGGDTKDQSNYEPEGIPDMANKDTIVLDQTTTDVFVSEIPMWYELDMTNFKGKIEYLLFETAQSGVFLNEDRYNIFNYLEHIKRVG